MRPYVLGLLTLLLLVSEPSFTNGLCNLSKDGKRARCFDFEDIKSIDTHDLKSLKISASEKQLSAETFGNLSSLRHLDLSNGKLRRIKPETFIHLRSLQSLDLSNNHLSHLGLGTFNGPLHLRHLDLRDNSLDQIPPDAADLKSLVFLDLSNNKLHCDCRTLKARDSLYERGINVGKKAICSGPGQLKDVPLSGPDSEVICMFEKQEKEDGMQADEPANDDLEGSGELGSGDPFDDVGEFDVPDDEESPLVPSEKPQEPTATAVPPIEVSLTSESTTLLKDDGMYFSEEVDKYSSTLSAPTSTESIILAVDKKVNTTEVEKTVAYESSGDNDFDDGSGFEGSGVGIVPPIDWGNVEDGEQKHNTDESTSESTNPQLAKTTESSLWWSLLDIFVSTESIEASLSSSTSPAPNFSDDVNLAQDEFLLFSSTTESSASVENQSTPIPEFEATVVNNKPNETLKTKNIDGSQFGKVQVEAPDDSNEIPDASTAIQSKKGMGSYIVLAVLLAVLATLILFAAYRGDFCQNGRKRNNRTPEIADVENGTELKDLTKSLLDGGNSVQPKIASNGSKPETVPLVASVRTNDTKIENEPTAKYVGAVSDSIADPVKPPRKSYSPNEAEVEKKNGTNGKVPSPSDISAVHTPAQRQRQPATKDILVNGKHDRDSLSSVGESPSSGSHSVSLSNQRLSQGQPPSSPGAQRVKITLQDNPDSVPKTPLLITRTKAGENLVKSP